MECYYGKGERRRVIGWLIGDRYLKHEIRTALGVLRQWPNGSWSLTHG